MNDVVQTISNAVGEINLAHLTVSAVLRLVITVAVGLIAIHLILKVLDRLLERSKTLGRLHVYIHSAVKVVLLLLLGMMVVSALGVDVTGVIALFSVAGLAVSLALQNTLGNLAGGIMLLVTHPFEAGDYIESDSVQGTVTGTDLVYTAVTTADNKAIFIPNSQLAGAKIINYNRLGRRRIDATYSASYDAPTAVVKAALQEAVDRFPQLLDDPKPEIYLSQYGDSAITYLVRAWVDSKDYWSVYYGLQEAVRDTFAAHGVEMTYNHLNVHMIKD